VRKAQTPPAPPAPDPQIAIEKAKTEKARRDAKAAALAEAEKQALQAKAEAARKAQQAKADAERERKDKQQLEAAAQHEREAQALKAQQAEDTRLAKLREDNLRRMRAQIGAPDATGGPGASGQAARDSAPSASYAGKVAKRIRDNIILTAEVPGNPVALVELRTGPSGTIIARRLLKSSGNRDWDEAVLRGVERTDSLPRDTDGRVPPTLELSLRPKE
jgi:colicin import membrane protein